MSATSYSEKVRRHRGLKKHLNELSSLVGRSIEASEISGAKEAINIQNSEKKFSACRTMSVETSFAEKKSEKFKSFIKELYITNPSPIQIWLPRTVDCGILRLPSILDVSFDFDFNINEEGVLVLMTDDMKDKLLLDFFVSEENERRLTIETQGVNWSSISY